MDAIPCNAVSNAENVDDLCFAHPVFKLNDGWVGTPTQYVSTRNLYLYWTFQVVADQTNTYSDWSIVGTTIGGFDNLRDWASYNLINTNRWGCDPWCYGTIQQTTTDPSRIWYKP